MRAEIALTEKLEAAVLGANNWPFLEPDTECFDNKVRVLELEDKKQIGDLIWAARMVIPKAIKFPESVEARKEGAAVVICNTDLNIPPIVFTVGNLDKPDPEFGSKESKYMLFALAKALFLKEIPAFRSSFQNCCFYDEDRWRINGVEIPAGAVRHGEWGKWIVSVSGLAPVKLDEICALGIFAKSGVITSNDAISYYDDSLIEVAFPRALNRLRELVSSPTT